MTNINPKFHASSVSATPSSWGGRSSRRSSASQSRTAAQDQPAHLGKLIMEIDGRDPMTLLPEQAFKFGGRFFRGWALRWNMAGTEDQIPWMNGLRLHAPRSALAAYQADFKGGAS